MVVLGGGAVSDERGTPVIPVHERATTGASVAKDAKICYLPHVPTGAPQKAPP